MFNISRQIYAGWDANNVVKHLPEAEIIPLGESVKEKKTLDKFVNKNTSLTEYDNVPLPGFTLYEVNKKNYSAADSTWLVIDPRGFLARITQRNMENILKVTGITEGLIQERCVWARDDNNVQMSLVPISSSLYIEAVNNTNLIESKVSINDVSIGDTVLLQNKLQGTYLGVMSLYCSMQMISGNNGFKAQAHLRKQVIEITPNKFYYQTNAGILKILEKSKTVITRDMVVEKLNNTIQTDPSAFFSSFATMRGQYYNSDNRVKFVSTHAAPKIKLELVEVDKNQAQLIFNVAYATTDNGVLIFENNAGKMFIIEYPWWGSSIPVSTYDFNVQEIEEVTEDRIFLCPRDKTKTAYSFDNFKKFYKIVKHVKNNTYI